MSVRCGGGHVRLCMFIELYGLLMIFDRGVGRNGCKIGESELYIIRQHYAADMICCYIYVSE